jgi:hypothetical protein
MRFLAEFYLPREGEDVHELAGRARAAADRASQGGPAVRFLYAVHAMSDESCFAVYDAESPQAVVAAGECAGIAFDRLVEATTAGPDPEGCCPR